MIEGQERADRCNLILPNCKHGRHTARSQDAADQTLTILSRLWPDAEKVALAAVASMRVWSRSHSTRPVFRVSGRLSRVGKRSSLLCPVHSTLGRCGDAPAGCTRASV